LFLGTQTGSDVKIESISSTNPMLFYTNNAERMRITSSGNVGIGVTPESDWDSTYKALQLNTTAAIGGHDAGIMLLSENYKYDGGHKYITTSEASRYMQSGGKHSFYTAPSGTADAAVSWTTALEITNDGRGLSQFTAKAWASWNLNGTASIHDSHNVSSLVDNGTGDSTINFDNDMANANYSVTGMSDDAFRLLSLRDQSYTNVAWTRFASTITSNTTWDDANRLMATWFGD